MTAVEPESPLPTSPPERAGRFRPRKSWRTWLIGAPMPTADAPHQTIGKLVGLAVFGADALSSIAYAPQETLVILAAAGPAAYGYAFPIAIVITILLAVVTISYQQTLHAYPNGGGAYTVARENLGVLAAQVAGVSLLIDYVLLAAVAISSGVAQIVSAVPALFPYRVELALVLLGLISIANLRGVKESGTAFALPTYFFLISMVLTVGVGYYRLLTGTLGPVPSPPPVLALTAQPLGVFLLLRAFANGTTALTGVECISNGITAFREPRQHNAARTMLWMSATLGVLFLGVTHLLGLIRAVPSEAETVISQLARVVYGGRGALYLATLAGTTVILILATNTAFADFPRLTAIIAADGFLPRQLTHRGSRLVFSRGIATLVVIAGLLIVLFQASVTALIPLWAVGVFVSFTLSQAGMARRWWLAGHSGQPVGGWRWKLAINGVGAAVTAVVAAIFAITKFRDGAWIIVLLVPALVALFYRIHGHYEVLKGQLSLEAFGSPPRVRRNRVIIPVAGVHRGVLAALDFARSLSADVTAVHISIDAAETEQLRAKWDSWGDGVRLVVVQSPYRAFVGPFLDYLDNLLPKLERNERITVVLPQFIPVHWWHSLLHTNAAFALRFALLAKHGIVVIEVPYQVD
ncbi:MAG: APC family permease [Anaerolineales bacterium]